MERLVRMDKERYLAEMQAEVRRILGEVADAVNAAPDGKVISGSEMQVREAMGELQRKAFEKALQMRVDSTESTFSPSAGSLGPEPAEQRAVEPEHADDQRSDRGASAAVVGGRRRKPSPG